MTQKVAPATPVLKQFKVDWTEESWFRTVVEAESAEQARDLFWEKLMSGEFAQMTPYSGEMQDSVEISEVD